MANHEQWQQGGNQAAEGDYQQDHGDRYRNCFGQGEVLGHLFPDAGAEGAADLDRDRVVVLVRVVLQDAGRTRGGLAVVTVDVGQDQGIGRVFRTQAGRLRGPIGRDARQSVIAAQSGREGLAAGGDGRAVDRSSSGLDQEDEVGFAAELLIQQLRGPARCRGRIIESAGQQFAEDADPQRRRQDEDGDTERQDEASPSGD
jgi:hypothetical protein